MLTLLGVVLGLALGFSQFERGIVFWFSFGYSISIVILVLGWILYGGISWMERVADLSNRLANRIGPVFHVPASERYRPVRCFYGAWCSGSSA